LKLFIRLDVAKRFCLSRTQAWRETWPSDARRRPQSGSSFLRIAERLYLIVLRNSGRKTAAHFAGIALKGQKFRHARACPEHLRTSTGTEIVNRYTSVDPRDKPEDDGVGGNVCRQPESRNQIAF